MACASCMKSKRYREDSLNKTLVSPSDPNIFNATDIRVYNPNTSEITKFSSEDWNNDRHKLILFFPKTFTPVCETEMGAVNQWLPYFEELNCDVYGATADPAHLVKEWFEGDDLLKDAKFKVLSSYLMPARLGLMDNGVVKRSSVFIMQDGEIVKQEHFNKVGRSLAELHRMLYGYSTDSYCAEGWQSPADGFLTPPNGD